LRRESRSFCSMLFPYDLAFSHRSSSFFAASMTESSFICEYCSLTRIK